jgi:hypothetical protein
VSQNTTKVKGLIQIAKTGLEQNVYNIVYLLNHAAHEYELFYTHTGQLHGFQFNCLSGMNTQNNKEKLCKYFSKTRQKNNCNFRVT